MDFLNFTIIRRNLYLFFRTIMSASWKYGICSVYSVLQREWNFYQKYECTVDTNKTPDLYAWYMRVRMLLILVMTAYILEAASHSRNEWKRNKNGIVYIQWRYTFFLRTALSTASLCLTTSEKVYYRNWKWRNGNYNDHVKYIKNEMQVRLL